MAADPRNGLWIVPSRRRPHNLKRFCEALVAARTETRGVFLVRSDELVDPDLAVGYQTVAAALADSPLNWSVVETRNDSQGDKLRERVDLYVNADWVGLLGDDQVVQTEHWDQKLIERLRGWNLVSCADDGWQVNERGGRIAGTMLWSGDLYRTVGYLFPPGMHHIYLDDVWEELGRITGCWSFAEHACLDVVIAHYHYTRGLAPKDETYSLAYDHFAGLDMGPWQQWRSHEMHLAAERVRLLINHYKN